MTSRGLLLILLFLFRAVAAQTPDELHEQVLALYSDRDYLTASALLTKHETDDPDSFRTNNYDYLLARIEERLGDFASAAGHYQQVVDRRSGLRDYALWRLSRIARASGNLMFERLLLQELTSFSPESLLAYPANRRLAESWLDGANYDLAITQLERSPAANTQNAAVLDSRERESLLAEAYLRSGDHAKAAVSSPTSRQTFPTPRNPTTPRSMPSADWTRSTPHSRVRRRSMIANISNGRTSTNSIAISKKHDGIIWPSSTSLAAAILSPRR